MAFYIGMLRLYLQLKVICYEIPVSYNKVYILYINIANYPPQPHQGSSNIISYYTTSGESIDDFSNF